MSDDRMAYDVLLVGGSPSNLALAHHLVSLCEKSGQSLNMAILEKGPAFGQHVMSGAVSKPHVIKRLFPDWQTNGFPVEAVCDQSYFSVLGYQKKWDVPGALLPPGLKKEGYFVLTLSEVVKWMADYLEARVSALDHVNVDLFPGFAVHALVYENDKVVGTQVVEQACGNPDEEVIYGHVLALGDKGFVSGDLIKRFNLRKNPQQWSVGVKEVWEISADRAKTLKGKVWHTMGFPVLDGTFGGGFVYGMDRNRLTIGLVISLDSENPNINPQQVLQEYKKHPWLQELIQDGKLLKYGAATLPEGGYYSLPDQFAVDGVLLLGDALGVLNIGTLAGIDKAMECGIQAAEVIHTHLGSLDFSAANLQPYQDKVMASHIGQELHAGRYFRHAWKENPRLLKSYLPCVVAGIDGGNPIGGLINVGLKNNPMQALSDALRLKGFVEGTANIGPLTYKKDYEYIVPQFQSTQKPVESGFVKETLYSRPDAVFYANPVYHEGSHHIDEFNADVCTRCIDLYTGFGKDTPCVSDCTAEVHRVDMVADLKKHGMSLENCVQCRTCEIVCPEENLKVRPTEQGAGPDFMGL